MESLAEDALVNNAEQAEGYTLLLPSFGMLALPLKRRAIRSVLESLIGSEGRIESTSIEAVLQAFDEDGSPQSGYVVNIQGDLAVSANKQRCAHRTYGALPHAPQARLTETFQSTLS